MEAGKDVVPDTTLTALGGVLASYAIFAVKLPVSNAE